MVRFYELVSQDNELFSAMTAFQ